MNFLASVKTPAELKMLENNATQKDVTREAGSGNNNTEQNDDDLEVGEDASTYDAKRIKFGNLGFISLANERCDDGASGHMVNDDIEDNDENHVPRKEVTTTENLACTDAVTLLDSNANKGIQDDVTEKHARDNVEAANITEEMVQIDTCSDTNKKKRKTAIESRNEAKKKRDSEPSKKSEAAAKKGFKDNVLTVKFKLSSIQMKAGKTPNFAIFIKDYLHHPEARNAAGHAGKYITYMKGDICDDFFSKKGIKFHPDHFFICKNDTDLIEDKLLPLQKANISDQPCSKPEDIVRSKHVAETEVVKRKDDHENDTDIDTSRDSKSDTAEEDIDIYNMGRTAKKVSFGAPIPDESEESFSSAGVVVYGRGAEKTISQEKKEKKREKKKHMKDSSAKTRLDILENDGFIAMERGLGRGRGRGKVGARDRGRGPGRGRSEGQGKSRSRGR